MSYSPPNSAKPFTLDVPEQDLSEWRQLLQLSKLGPDTYEGRQEDGRFGITHKWLSDTKDFWLNEYNWRAEEKYINSFDNYRIQIEDIDVHFLALFSKKKDAIPILFMHGWPGSFIEFLPLCEIIRKQYSDEDLPYHIIVPSLPGYTLSAGLPVDRDWTIEDTARIMNQLMLDLGFDKYIAQGGDIGSFEACILSRDYDACVAIHLNMLSPREEIDEATLSASEKKSLERAKAWRETGMAYFQVHSTKPSTIGHVLSSNPLALLAWIGEKFLSWSSPTTTPPLRTILTNISLYYFTSSITQSIYPYRNGANIGRLQSKFLSKPTGFSSFAFEIFLCTEAVLKKKVNLVAYRRHEDGGHFAALECAGDLWGDVEGFVKQVWGVR